MSGVENRTVAADDDGMRLDRWFKKYFPEVGFGALQKLMRTGQVRLDGGRVKPADRVSAGQSVRIPPLQKTAGDEGKEPKTPTKPSAKALNARDVAEVRSWVISRDDDVIVLNKPAGLAVQGGSGTTRHLDGLLDALTFDAAERPKLVHRLDKDTSGLMVLARNDLAARKLTEAFRAKTTRKLYWALVVGEPKPSEGRIEAPLAKLPGKAGERVVVDEEQGKRAVTWFRTVEKLARRVAWVAMEPVTGRTHQLRVHMADVLGCPILGDGKYGGADAFIDADGIARRLHLHARALDVPHPRKGRIEAEAPLPDHFRATFSFLGFDEAAYLASDEAGFMDLPEVSGTARRRRG